MRKSLQKFTKVYSRSIRKNIGIFIFTGLLGGLFAPQGWLPDENIYAISLLISGIVLPAFLAYSIAELLSDNDGGVIAVLASAGIIVADVNVGIPGALLMGIFCGILWKYLLMPLNTKVKAGFEFLCKNLAVAFSGLVLSLAAYFVAAPILAGIIHLLERGLDFLIQEKLMFLLSVVIEPAKILFLNNSINYGLLIPLGMQQAEQSGSSILFLLESNPGPGFGVLFAMLLTCTKKRREYGLGAVIQIIGGIHEIYFPLVLSNIRLVFPLIAGGITGTVCFNLLGAGLSAPAAPGSLLTILLVSKRGQQAGVLLGIFLSAIVSMTLSLTILQLTKQRKETADDENSEPEDLPTAFPGQRKGMKEDENSEPEVFLTALSGQRKEMQEDENSKQEVLLTALPGQKRKMSGNEIPDRTVSDAKTELEVSRKMQMTEKGQEQSKDITNRHNRQIHRIGFICDGGMGSSAMGASLLRRRLKEKGILNIEVTAHAGDMIPEGLDLLICQKSYLEVLRKEIGRNRAVYAVETLLDISGFDALIELLQKGENSDESHPQAKTDIGSDVKRGRTGSGKGTC